MMKMDKLTVATHSVLSDTIISLPASKSVANRALIIDALAGGNSDIDNLSEARDTQTMRRLLHSKEETLDVLDAGTTMRFLTAFLTVTNREAILTGTPRMCQRPIKLLVDALRELGGEIVYVNEEGYPPMRIKGLSNQKSSKLSIRGDISSQYISALLMIAPTLPQGLELTLTGKVGSRPYIAMTLKVMETFNVKADWNDNVIKIGPQAYTSSSYKVEPDWSAASYWYAMASLSKSGEILLKDLKSDSLQGDQKIAELMTELGVSTEYNSKGALLKRIAHKDEVSIDFTHCPDLAQTICTICAAKGITCHMVGLESLRIKETDRIAALQNELGKIGAKIHEDNGKWTLVPGIPNPQAPVEFDTYDDHRMAMALAPLACLFDVIIDEPGVVAKSYPRYWEDLEKAGFSLS